MATAAAKPKAIKKHPWEPKRQFAFDLTKPIMKGPLLKQGGFHKAFKERYFILYPGFLVYYDEEITWQYDLQRGETLGSRISAIKLKGGSVAKTRNPPKGAKFAFTIQTPDPSNKRSDVTFNCHSNEERYQWMTKIHSAIPRPPQSATADKTPPPKEEQKQEETDKPQPDAINEEPAVEEPASTPKETGIGDEETGIVDVCGDEPTEEEVFGPRDITDAHSSESDSERLSNDHEVTVVSVSIDVNGKGSPSGSLSSGDEHKPEDIAVEENVATEDIVEMESTEVTIQPTDPNMSISVVDPGNAGSDGDTSDELSSEEDVPLPETPSSTGEELASRPSITVEEFGSERQPEAENNERQPKTMADKNKNAGPLGTESPIPVDKRRPSGCMPFIEKTGNLYKCGGKHKTWHLRYFILQPGKYTYYKKKGGKQLGEVKLKSLKVIMPYPGEKTYSSYQFTIHTESQWNRRNDYVIAASSQREMDDWISAFKMASGTLRMSPDHEGEPLPDTP